MTMKHSKLKKFAVFDIDGTIFRSSLLVEIVEEFVAEGIFPERAMREYTRFHIKWLEREGSYDDYILSVVRVFLRNLKGVQDKDLARIGERVVQRQGKHCYRFTRDLLRDLKKRGYFLVAISQSPKRVLDTFCKDLGFDLVYGRMYELDAKNRFTGKTFSADHIADKANVLKRAIEKYGLTLNGSVGVGDTEGDISMLGMVDLPIAFNPNAKLLKAANKKKWRVVVERKDVIYEIA